MYVLLGKSKQRHSTHKEVCVASSRKVAGYSRKEVWLRRDEGWLRRDEGWLRRDEGDDLKGSVASSRKLAGFEEMKETKEMKEMK